LVGRDAAETYERDLVPAMFAPWAPGLIDLAGVRRGERVLDVACGTGVVTRLAAGRVGSAGRVVGLDSNGAMLEIARSLPPLGRTGEAGEAGETGGAAGAGATGEDSEAGGAAAIEWLEASALDLPLPDAAFDVVLCQQGLQQFSDRPAALREMRRVLVPGGRLAAGVWSRIEANPGMAALVAALARHVGPEAAANRRAPFALGDAAEVRDLLAAAGFRNVEVRTLAGTARFPSPEHLVEAQLAATPLSTLGVITGEVRAAIAGDVRAALAPYLECGALSVPMEIHVGLGLA